MRTIKMVGLAFAAVLALAAVSASAAAAHQFTSTGLGSLLGKALNTQVFKTAGGEVKCTKLTVSGTAGSMASETQVATVKYENCTAYTIINASITPAEYEFNANGTVNVLKEIVITASSCTDRVPAQTGLTGISYKSEGGEIEVIAATKNITSTGEGLCKYAEEHEGEYKGKSSVMESAGSLGWE